MVEIINQSRSQLQNRSGETRHFKALFLLITLAILTLSSQAHRLDEYLQATLIDIETNAITLALNLTPGVAVADAVLSPLDTNYDGQISITEAQTYAENLLSNLSLRLGEQPLSLQLTAVRFPPVTELREGVGAIHLELRAALVPLTPGPHELYFKNRHRPDLSVYLVNAVIPQSTQIQITRQIRNTTQSESRIQFTYSGPPKSSPHRLQTRDILGWLILIIAITTVLATIRRTPSSAFNSNQNNEINSRFDRGLPHA